MGAAGALRRGGARAVRVVRLLEAWAGDLRLGWRACLFGFAVLAAAFLAEGSEGGLAGRAAQAWLLVVAGVVTGSRLLVAVGVTPIAWWGPQAAWRFAGELFPNDLLWLPLILAAQVAAALGAIWVGGRLALACWQLAFGGRDPLDEEDEEERGSGGRKPGGRLGAAVAREVRRVAAGEGHARALANAVLLPCRLRGLAGVGILALGAAHPRVLAWAAEPWQEFLGRFAPMLGVLAGVAGLAWLVLALNEEWDMTWLEWAGGFAGVWLYLDRARLPLEEDAWLPFAQVALFAVPVACCAQVASLSRWVAALGPCLGRRPERDAEDALGEEERVEGRPEERVPEDGAPDSPASPYPSGRVAASASRAPREEDPFAGLIGVEDAVEQLRDLIDGYRAERGGRLAVLLSGPPGTGKSTLARAAARYAGMGVVEVRAGQVLGSLVGASERALSGLFAQAREAGAAVVIDELDALGRARDGRSLNRPSDLLLPVLLAELEGPGLVLATTNRAGDLDPALRRRFDAHLELGLPGFAERKELWAAFLRGERLGVDVDLEELARRSAGMSPAEIRSAASSALRVARARERRGGWGVWMADLCDALERR